MVKSCCQFTLGFMVVALALFYAARTIESDAHYQCSGSTSTFVWMLYSRASSQANSHRFDLKKSSIIPQSTKFAILMEFLVVLQWWSNTEIRLQSMFLFLWFVFLFFVFVFFFSLLLSLFVVLFSCWNLYLFLFFTWRLYSLPRYIFPSVSSLCLSF